MNQTLALYRVFYDWDDEEDLFVGMIDPSLPTEFGGGIATSGTDSVSMRMHDGFSSSWPWSHNGAETLAHEAGHAAGLPHVPCKDDDEDGVADEIAGGSVDLSHPAALTFPVCTLADEDPEGYYGFDVYWDLWSLPGPTVIGNDRSHAAPNKAWPLMAYQNPGWPDPYHYCRLLEHYGVPCDPTDLGIPWSEPDAAAGGPLTAPPDPTHDELPPGSTGVLGISGQLDTAAGTGQMQAGFVTDAPTPTAMDRYSGQYLVVGATHRLRVLDAGGGELASVPFEQQTPSEEPTTNIAFDLLVPSFPDAAAYQLLSGEVEIARLEVSPSAPTVTAQPISREPDATGRVRIRFPWLAADADGDPLTATVLYAPDGEHWQVLATGLTDPFFEVAEDTLPGGSAPVFQVIVMDATRAASVISGPMEAIAGLPPEVVADARSGASYPQGADVVLRATAFDPEDRMLGGDAITWASSVAGELGTGTELVVADLAAGGHTITVTATDSDGLADAVSFELLIDPNVTQPQPDPAVEADIAAIFAALAAGEDPADVIGGGPDLAVILVVAGIALILVGGVGTVLLRRRRSTAGAPPPAAPPPAASPPASPPAA
jgi:hypothetical protein